MNPAHDRYSRQIRFAGIGDEGQQRICQSRVLICGCGALGTVLADTLARAGVGLLRIVDRDFVDLSNLQRQVLFDETDVAAQLPKSIVAADRLRRVNSTIQIEPHVADLDAGNIGEFAAGIDLILDGTDNFETRFLINDASLGLGIPWVYAGVVGSHGQTMAVLPGRTACLRCIVESPPEPGQTETCDTAGVISPAIHMVTALQAALALRILAGQGDAIPARLYMVDVWDPTLRPMNLDGLRQRGDCPACGPRARRDWLHGARTSQTTILCGRNSVQIAPAERQVVSLDEFAERLSRMGTVTRNPFLLRFGPRDQDVQLTLFRDGRVIVQGTEDLSVARGLYSRYIGG